MNIELPENLLNTLICTCDACHYTFEDTNLPDRCPDCGKPAVRITTDSEITDYIQIRAEIAREEKEGSY